MSAEPLISTRSIGLLLFGFVLTSTTTYADPIRVTSGHVFFDLGIDPSLSFDFVGRDLQITSTAFNDSDGPHEFDLDQFPFPERLSSGTRLDLSSQIRLMQAFDRGTLPSLLAGNFAFFSGTARLACHDDAESGLRECTARAPFSFAGHLRSLTTPPGTIPFDVDLVGHGTAFTSFQGLGDDNISPGGSGATYVFEPVATPEPATLLFVGCGLVGIATRCRRLHRFGCANLRNAHHRSLGAPTPCGGFRSAPAACRAAVPG